MQAIFTKWLPPTNWRPSRIKAWCDAGSVTVPWDFALGVEANHDRAARALLAMLEWCYPFQRGSAPLKGVDAAYVYVRRGKEADL